MKFIHNRFLGTLSLCLLLLCWATLTKQGSAQTFIPAPPVSDGQDGLLPTMKLTRSEVLHVPASPNPRVPLWYAYENWYAPGRYIRIVRIRFSSRQDAVNAILSVENPGPTNFIQIAGAKWDATALLGSRSVVIPAKGIGLDMIMFVQDKQFVFLEYTHSASQNSTSSARILQLGQVVLANILARHESGENEPESDAVPPTITITANPTELWPPNHKMVKITLAVHARDNLEPNPVVRLVGVTSNEGNASQDIQVDADGGIWLRSERGGNSNGRVYTIIYKATDAAGNIGTASVNVTVPHDQEKKK